MRAMERRAAEIADRARRRRASEVADQLQELVPDAEVREREARIEIAGVGLRTRWLNNPALRFFAKALS